jgi:hypothetical protein
MVDNIPNEMRCPCCGGALMCDGCGSRETIEAIQAKHPGAIACCPERKLVAVRPLKFEVINDSSLTELE